MPKKPLARSSKRSGSFAAVFRCCVRYVAFFFLVGNFIVILAVFFRVSSLESLIMKASGMPKDMASDVSLGDFILRNPQHRGDASNNTSALKIPIRTKSINENNNAHDKDQLLLQESSASSKPAYQRRRIRFPEYGTPEYSALCPWAVDTLKTSTTSQDKDECTFLVRPNPNSNEGISAWASDIVAGYLQVAQTSSCHFRVDYGMMDLSSIVQPHPQLKAVSTGSNYIQQHRFDWVTPLNFTCQLEHHCYENIEGRTKWEKAQQGRVSLVNVPTYRHLYSEHFKKMRKHLKLPPPEDYGELRQHFSGFHESIAFACSMAKLFQLSPNADQYEPKLYTDLMPTLVDKDSFVVSLYIREGFTDRQAEQEAKNLDTTTEDNVQKFGGAKSARGPVDCAMALEREVLKASSDGTLKGRTPKQIIWLVVSDSNAVKEFVQSQHGGQSVTVPTIRNGDEYDQPPPSTTTIQRRVVYTSSHGRHTKPKQSPKTTDLADAFIDWYLIAESDAVVTSDGLYSFGMTAGLRTARPIYTENPYREAKCRKGGASFDCFCKTSYDESGRIESMLANM